MMPTQDSLTAELNWRAQFATWHSNVEFHKTAELQQLYALIWIAQLCLGEVLFPAAFTVASNWYPH